MKKHISVIVSVILAVSALCAACSEPQGRTWSYRGEDVMDHLGPSTGTITFMVSGDQYELTNWNNLIDGFESKNPGIQVNQVYIADSDTLYAQLSAGTAPDVVMLNSPLFGSWAKDGAFMSLQPFIERDNYDTSDFWDQAVEMFSFNTTTGTRGVSEGSELFGLPKDLGVNGIFVNRTLIEQAYSEGRIDGEQYAKVTNQDEPMYFEDYIEIAHALTQYDAENPINSVYGSNRIYWESYLWSLGEDILVNHQLNKSDLVKKVFEYSRSMVTVGDPMHCAPYTPVNQAATSSTTERQQFLAGKLCMIWTGRWYVPSFDASAIDYYCIPIPIANPDEAENTLDYPITYTSTVGYAISRNCEKTEMAWKFIQYLASEDGYKTLNLLNFNVPGRKSLIEFEEFKKPMSNNGKAGYSVTKLDEKSAKTFFDVALSPVPFAVNNDVRYTSNRWKTLFENRLSEYLAGDIATVDEFLNLAETEVNAAIRQSNPELFE